MKLYQGDIVILNFPFSDQSGYKLRPAIVVSNALINKTSDVILAAITSQFRNDSFTFALENKFLTQALHRNDCEVRCNNLFTTEKSVIVQKISALKPEKMNELSQKIISGLTV